MPERGGLTACCVVPARGHGELLRGCLDGLRAQDHAPDELIVVDDSPTAELTTLDGVRVLHSKGRGPYAARNLGWQSTDADVILFLDARSRPRPGWARGMLAPFADPAVALVGSEVRVEDGPSLGAQAMARHQPFKLDNYLAAPFFRPYLPTCNLAVRRSDLERVDGFSEVRSGGDADLCWRVLAEDGRRLRPVPDVLMDWVPRDRLRDYLEQNYRYGKSHRDLCLRWASEGAVQADALSRWTLAKRLVHLGGRFAVASAARRRTVVLDLTAEAAGLSFQTGLRVAIDADRLPFPVPSR